MERMERRTIHRWGALALHVRLDKNRDNRDGALAMREEENTCLEVVEEEEEEEVDLGSGGAA